MRIRVFTAAVGLVVASACTSGPPPPPGEASSIQSVEEWRATKEQYMREDPESPVPESKRSALLPLRYYEADASYVVPAELKLYNERSVLEMPTSTGTLRKMERVGTLMFALHGQPMTLDAFVEAGQRLESLFVPFADATTTSGETYAAGRYLDIPLTRTGLYEVDFNKAYNPFCAYNERYECPFPPASNRLKVAIRAGEKVPGA